MQLLLVRLHAGAHPNLTSFFSLEYLVLLLPICILVYALTPGKWKKYTLLLESLSFFWLVSGQRILYLLFSIVTVWGGGLWLDALHRQRDAAVKAAEKAERKAIKKAFQDRARLILTGIICLNIGILLVLKYSGFFTDNVNHLLGADFPIPSYIMPIGISFYSLSAVSYIMDVYRETIPADRNGLRLALFLSFFPQIVEGPICRYSHTAQQLWDAKAISRANLILGSQRILYGLLKKLVIADRLNAFVDVIFTNWSDYPGGWVAVAAVCYTIQLYMDFSGSMDAVCGVAQIFGITMPENFRQPFFSKTISEFWTRWHISLGTWFKDYIFYPVTMSKPMKNLTSAARKKLGNHFGPLIAGSIALFCVWFCNGLWHGAAWTFIFFGMYHFAIILTGNIIAPYVKKANQRFGIPSESIPYRLLQTLRTCILVVIGELFFRAESMASAFRMLGWLKADPHLFTRSTEYLRTMGIDSKDFAIVAVTMLIVLSVSILKERNVAIRQALQERSSVLRWAVLYALILYIVIFGAYGVGYIPVDPMYANF